MFNWLREKVKAAVLAGINDALQEVQQPVAVEPVVLQLDYQRDEGPVNGRKREGVRR